MKKLFGIIVIGLLLNINGFADVEDVIKEIKKNKDIAQGFKNVREFDKWNEWRVNNSKILDSDKSSRKHVLKVVNKIDNYPVRFGKQSLKFEVRDGDGWGWDAKNDRERVELLICCVNREKITWTSWSLYLPDDYKIIFPAKTMLAQFHNDADNPPAFAFENQSHTSGGGYWIDTDKYITGYNYNRQSKILDSSEMYGKWNDILVKVKWTHEEDGFFKIWTNGKLAFHHKGKTQDKDELIEFHIGVYRSYLSRTSNPDSTQIAYYDEIRHAETCKKLKLKDLGYSCKEIESQR
jgi:hypothetical protein|tara:strand:- start:165 stop:1043 length:879 start_codon:yes stop_codon:yes gene_type:complete